MFPVSRSTAMCNLTYRKIKISFLRDFGNESVAIGLHAIAEVLQ